MPSSSQHPLQFFGPDLSRGPFTSASPPVAAIQLATAIAQLRAPLLRSDAEIQAHADFIRGLADRLFPDFAEQIQIDVGDEASDRIATSFRVNAGNYSLLHCWLADAHGGGETALAPTAVTWASGTLLQTITAGKRFLVVAPTNGVLTANVDHSGDRTWYWAVARHGRVYYSTSLNFD